MTAASSFHRRPRGTCRSRGSAAPGTSLAARGSRADARSSARCSGSRSCSSAGASACGALLDRCPHRNVPLSLGTVVGGELECRYHGWQFDCRRPLRLRPGPREATGARRGVPRLPVREHDGFVWVWPELDGEPDARAVRSAAGRSDAATPRRARGRARGPRSTRRSRTRSTCRTPRSSTAASSAAARGTRSARLASACDRVEVEYVGEPRPEGLVGGCCRRAAARSSTGIASSCRRSPRSSTGSAKRRTFS